MNFFETDPMRKSQAEKLADLMVKFRTLPKREFQKMFKGYDKEVLQLAELIAREEIAFIQKQAEVKQ